MIKLKAKDYLFLAKTVFKWSSRVFTGAGVNWYLTMLQLVLTQLFCQTMRYLIQELICTPSLNMLKNE